MSGEIIYRAAAPSDAYALAELLILSGDGIYQFLLQEMAPQEMLAGLMARSIKRDEAGFSYRHCFIAAHHGAVIGMINAYPAAWLREEERDPLPPERVQVLDPIDQAQDWESFLVNGVAVRPQYRRRGIGTRLVEWVVDHAKAAAFARLTANVWADNAAARGLFEKTGFLVQRTIEVSPHPELSHQGGSLSMTRSVDAP